MVSFWPFKGDDTSAANFEKTLSTLTTKLQKANERDALLRTRSRRLKALWTLYTSFIYILYTLILALVTGYQRWGPPEYGAVLGGPVAIYTVRAALAAYYDYMLGTNRAYIRTVTAQRKTAIDKFKHATKYDSTQLLLQKYGEEQPKAKQGDAKDKGDDPKAKKERDTGPPRPLPARTNLPPPPTANIQRPGPPSPQQQQPQPPPDAQAQQSSSGPAPSSPQGPPGSPDAAAFSPQQTAMLAPAQYAAAPSQPQWYDRLFDVLLGDDETKAVNRLALICEHCRLVNGQAPPGVRSLAELGRWRCGECKAWNGQESEVKKLMQEVGAGKSAGMEKSAVVDEDEAADEEREASAEEDQAPPARSTRSRAAKAHEATS